MNIFVLLAQAGEGGGQVQQIARSFGVNWPHLIAQAISFGIVCALLARFAYRPVLAMLAERRRIIEESLANAEKIKAELARTEEHRQESVREASTRAAKLIEEARAAAAQLRERETQRATAAGEEIIAKARQAADQDHDRMLTELKREVGRLVVQAASAVTGKILTTEDQERLADEAVKQFAR
jgi:F-type H+-transporting ATPase subunit b